MSVFELLLDIVSRIYGCFFFVIGWLVGTAISATVRGFRIGCGYDDYEVDAWES